MPNKLLRRIFFPQRDHRYASETDVVCQRQAQNLVGGNERAAYELELETRQWIRDFKSKSIVSWIALCFSLVALTLSVRSCHSDLRLDHRTHERARDDTQSH